MKKILVIGKKGFISFNLIKFLRKKKIILSSINFENFLKKKKQFYNKFNIIINCSSNIKFIKKRYNHVNDNELIIAKKISDLNIKLITLSTRKVYKKGTNIKETSIIKPSCNYSKNKLISEIAVQKILKNKSLILRIVNLIGLPIKNKRKLHNTFIDIFFKKVNQGIIYDNKKNFKDFLSITKFNEIVFKLIQKNAFGIYNVSLGKKVFLNDIIMWLNFYNKKKTKTTLIKKNFKSDNFTLNNKKLLNIIKIKIDINNLKNECFLISRKFFLKK